ncbi:hypothetical protein F4677DRAFT_85044 [Hypoxylon crocopeplum]|nr:hypothetical protein F4677DRAFT_85044 [Hypoxylon crocopeplum]
MTAASQQECITSRVAWEGCWRLAMACPHVFMSSCPRETGRLNLKIYSNGTTPSKPVTGSDLRSLEWSRLKINVLCVVKPVPPHLIDAMKRQASHGWALVVGPIETSDAVRIHATRSYHMYYLGSYTNVGACSSASRFDMSCPGLPRLCRGDMVGLQASIRLKAPDVPFGIGGAREFFRTMPASEKVDLQTECYPRNGGFAPKSDTPSERLHSLIYHSANRDLG